MPGPGPVLVRFGEIGIKSAHVRLRFERRLVEAIEEALTARGVEGHVDRAWGRLYVHATDVEGAVDAAAHTFGVVSASPATEVPADLHGLVAAVREAAADLVAPEATFAVRARRSGNHPFTSQDVARAVGAAVLEAVPAAKVDLTDPDVEVHLEIRENHAYLFTRTVPGPGGLPVGAQGRAVAFVASPRDAAAAWLILRRGANVTVVVPRDHGDDVARAVDALRTWVPKLKVHTDRRERLAVLAAWTRRAKANAAVVGDTWPDAAEGLDAALPVPVFRPLLGYPPARFAELVRTIGLDVAEEATA